jgi:hypothetical protein
MLFLLMQLAGLFEALPGTILTIFQGRFETKVLLLVISSKRSMEAVMNDLHTPAIGADITLEAV